MIYQQLLPQIDRYLAALMGSDDHNEQATGHYLHAHLSVAKGYCDTRGPAHIHGLCNQMHLGLLDAFLNGELDEAQRRLVEYHWQQCRRQLFAEVS